MPVQCSGLQCVLRAGLMAELVEADDLEYAFDDVHSISDLFGDSVAADNKFQAPPPPPRPDPEVLMLGQKRKMTAGDMRGKWCAGCKCFSTEVSGTKRFCKRHQKLVWAIEKAAERKGFKALWDEIVTNDEHV